MFSFTAFTALFGAVVGFFLYDPKAIPGLWHARMIAILAKHLLWKGNQSLTETSAIGPLAPSTIFRPRRTHSYCSIAEIDLNMHKSNSTFYADIDLSRIELLATLFKDAITPLSPRASLAPDNAYSRRNRRRQLIAALGGINGVFRREIKPYQRYELVSRVLAWDEKWIYIVSYFLKPSQAKKDAEITDDRILASAVSKYVFKQGRQTVEPAEVLTNLGLLAGDHAAQSDADDSADVPASAPEHLPLPRQDLVDYPNHSGSESDEWTWSHVEVERKRGLAIAKHLVGLNGV
ncbi:uncharacterized protein N7483_012775 [Penicillium malachiteum]|uniref:uncharacterized protein n=1 Tax=Penicillium malachiteum TaxID=1324776 RepID=UPI0025479DFF|nr:uncharacterized protein N7483_012775 [Penicillium malachiteum]KAJ5715594.1 hypothetical protein N7483_012775 [Penicillium malachiteum]